MNRTSVKFQGLSGCALSIREPVVATAVTLRPDGFLQREPCLAGYGRVEPGGDLWLKVTYDVTI